VSHRSPTIAMFHSSTASFINPSVFFVPSLRYLKSRRNISNEQIKRGFRIRATTVLVEL